MRIRRFPLMTAVLCVVVWLAADGALGQEYRGRVQGVITDNTSAVVPGAMITLLNAATGVAFTTQSDPGGRYVFNMVQPGQYTVTAEMQGFSKFVQQNVSVPVSGDVSVNIALTVGATSESITVTSEVPALKFTSANIDTVITQKMVETLPLPTRNPFALAMLETTADFDSRGGNLEPFNIWGSTNIRVGGANNRQGELLLDGSPTKIGSTSGYAPNVNAVQEFIVLQNSTDAEYGFSGGGIITLASKSGTNGLHGTFLYMGRNPILNARIFKYNTVNAGRRNIFDISAGNPIIKNKLFTFTSYEDWRWKDILSMSGTQPTDLERQGDFSQTLTRTGVLRPIFDPMTTVLNTSTNTATRQPFPGNRIPTSQIDPTSARMMTYMWKPNRAPDDPSGLNNFQKDGLQNQFYWNFLNRTDWNVNSKLRIYGRFSKNFRRNDAPVTGSIAESNSRDGRRDHNTNFMSDATYTLTSATVFDVRASYGYIDQLFPTAKQAIGYEKFASLWGGNDWGKLYYGKDELLRFPRLNIGGKTSYGTSSGWLQYGWNYTVQPKVATIRGKHYMKIGADIRQQNFKNGWPVVPSFSFGPADTASTYINPNTTLEGDGYASYLLGGIASGSAPYNTTLRPRDTYVGSFFQDDMKLTTRVTLNLGLRVDKDTGILEENNYMMRYVDMNNTLPALSALNPALPPAVMAVRDQYGIGAPKWNGGAVFADNSHRRQFNTSVQFQPRIGAAIRLNDQMSLRLGYARWTVPPISVSGTLQTPTGMGGTVPFTAYGFTTSTSVQGFLTGKPTTFLNNPFPSGLVPALGKALGQYTQVGDSIRWPRQDYEPIISDRFTFSLQREMPKKIVGDFTYLYHYGTNVSPYNVDDGQTYWTNLNLVDPRIRATLKSALDAQVTNPFYNALTTKEIPGVLRTRSTVTVGSLLTPYPHYTELQEMGRPGFHNRYHSLEFKATRPMADGLHFMAIYSWGLDRFLQFLGGTLDEFLNNPRYITRADPRHRFNAVVVSELPFGHGRKFLSGANRLLNAALGGWNFSAIYTWRSGNQIALGDWIMTGNPVLSNRTGSQWFDGSVFSRKTDSYALRTTPAYFPGLTNPGSWNLDATMSKEFRVTERLALEFRLEAYNATNTWLQPYPRTNVDEATTFGRIINTDNSRSSSRYCQYQLRLNF